jgi:hypothetical protein
MSKHQIDSSKKPRRIFSEEELRDFSKGFMELALEGINSGDLEKARYWCQREADTHDALHDTFVDTVAALLSFIYDKLGEETAVYVLREVMARQLHTPELIAQRKQMGLAEKVRWLADVWRQQSTNPGLIVEEDDEKFTITVKCGSGAKLIEKGAYQGSNGFRKLEKAGPHSWGEVNLPIYCGHCPQAHEILPIETVGQGAQFWIHVSPFPKKPGDPCVHLIYKNPEDIPDKYYHRLGLEKIKT